MGRAGLQALRSPPAAVRRLSTPVTPAATSHDAPTALLTIAALVAFAGNSLLCRLALTRTSIDAASFTTIRIVAGAVVLLLVVRLRDRGRSVVLRQPSSAHGSGSWISALALFAYAAGFSFAYVRLTAGTGALLLFGAVQATMISVGVLRGERLRAVQWCGLLLAYAGLVALVLPGLAAPPLVSALLMLGAGVAWGAYSLRAKAAGDPTSVTAGNFARAIPMAIAVSLVMLPARSIDGAGAAYAIASGAVASGVGYAIWYTALRTLRATTAATVQLSVPVLAALGGVVLLAEPLTVRLVLTGAAILGGVALVVLARPRAAR
ncbi:MAG TPA: DMT family transporter [Gemmatimonadaceae bacterium]|nr:DMT family transporter [Gemmatimonadaceae bacterium]